VFRKIFKELSLWAVWITLSLTAALALNNFILVNAQVLTGSMEGTIMTQGRVFGLRTPLGRPNRGDIIVFESPIPAEYTEMFIKRIIALGGEEVEIIGGVTYVNGEPLEENYVSEPMLVDFGPMIVPYDQVFVMGDNRNNSRDSREWGPIPQESILGRVYIIMNN
jgi:signal peptidase I